MECYFFGTFNPIHLGHMEIARQVKEKLGFKRIVFVPSYMPPHKVDGLLPFKHRLEMAKIALGEENVSDIELKLKVPSYTYRTIEKIFDNQGQKRVNFIIGYDQFFKLESWKEPEILKEKIHFIVIPRRFRNGQTLANAAFQYFKNKGFDFEIVDINFLDISSSMIRNCAYKGEELSGLVTKEVKEYIENNRLYTNVASKQSYI